MLRYGLHGLFENITLFDLKGTLPSAGGVCCAVAAGEGRSVPVWLDPKQCTMDYLNTENGQRVWLYDIPAPLEQRADGTWFFDAAAFLAGRGVEVHPCSDALFQIVSSSLVSDTLDSSPFGAVVNRRSLLGFPQIQCAIHPAPGALTIDAQAVDEIYWSTTDPDSAADGKHLSALTTQLLAGPNALNSIAFLTLFLGKNEEGMPESFTIVSGDRRCAATLGAAGTTLHTTLYDKPLPLKTGGTRFALRTLLQLFRADSPQKLENFLAKATMLGLF